jgi:hypothetical protein
MILIQKIQNLQENHFSEWLKTRREVADELSEGQSIYCICGRLATGLHESNCWKFRNKVDSETVKKLKHLIKK